MLNSSLNRSFISSVLLAGSVFCVPNLATGQNTPAHAALADERVAAAERKVKAAPESYQSYNDLAAALCRKGRDTQDIAVYDQASAALARSQKLSPANYEARKLEVTVLLGKHDFGRALQLASELNHKVPDDIAGWALLVDTNIALGNYAQAEHDAQWILDLRQGSALGFEKAAFLRELFGDVPGAVEFFDEANRRTSANDTDQHAWLLTQKARLQLAAGYDKQSEELIKQVLQLYPDSQLATTVLSKIRALQGNYTEAAALLDKCYQRVPSSHNLYTLAEALERSGQRDRAAAAFVQFVAQAEAESAGPYNSNLELAFYYLDHKDEKPKALALTTRLAAQRHDCATLDAYAWALYNNGRHSEAKVQMDRALAVGVRDPVYFCHATQIAARSNDLLSANKFKNELLTFPGSACPIKQPNETVGMAHQ